MFQVESLLLLLSFFQMGFHVFFSPEGQPFKSNNIIIALYSMKLNASASGQGIFWVRCSQHDFIVLPSAGQLFTSNATIIATLYSIQLNRINIEKKEM